MPYYDQSKAKWRGEVQIKDPSGKTVRKTRLFATKKEAAKWEMEEAQAIKHPPAQTTSMAFSHAYTQYLDFCEHRYSRKTFQEKKALAQRLIQFFGGDREMEGITAKDMQDFLIESAKDKSNNRANRDRKNLLSFWNWCQRILEVQPNPIAKLDKLPHHRKEQYVPMPGDINKILMAATRTERAFLTCYLQTAARRTEIFRWKWGEDVDFHGRQVRLGTMKTKDGSMEYTWLPMTDELFVELQWWYKNRQDHSAEYVWTIPEGPRQGEHYTTRRKFMAGLCKRAGIRPFGFHGLRRYAASLLASRGVPMKIIQMILRHSALATTENYIKVISDDMRGTMELLSSADASKINSHPNSHPKEKGSA